MLLENKNQIAQEVDGLRIKYGNVQAEVVELLNELEVLRDDAVHMMAERRRLEQEVHALRRRADDVTISDDAPRSGRSVTSVVRTHH